MCLHWSFFAQLPYRIAALLRRAHQIIILTACWKLILFHQLRKLAHSLKSRQYHTEKSFVVGAVVWDLQWSQILQRNQTDPVYYLWLFCSSFTRWCLIGFDLRFAKFRSSLQQIRPQLSCLKIVCLPFDPTPKPLWPSRWRPFRCIAYNIATSEFRGRIVAACQASLLHYSTYPC